MPDDIEEQIRKAAVLNAIRHEGRADAKAVLGSLLGSNASLRGKAKELLPQVRQVVEEVNATSLEELRETAGRSWPEELAREKVEEERKLPPLPNVENYSVIVTRIAPNPDFVLHIGNARAAILSHDYARMYKGKFLIRFEDTDPRLKKAQLRYYDLIREDLRWLDCEWDAEYVQSDRLPEYYKVAEELLAKGAAYICECEPEAFRNVVNAGAACPDRNQPVPIQKQRWQRMLSGEYGEGKAVFRVKTDLSHPNPAIRDWPALRIIDTEKNPHPRIGSKFRVWPLYNLASGVDDHEMGITHVIRGKEHLTNMARQLFLYEHLGWKYPEAVHYGRLKVEGMDLSKSKMMRGVDSGEFQGIDDPRLGTLAALRRRGYSPETIRKLIWEVGPKPVDVTVSWENVNAINRKIIDPTSHRFFFVSSPLLAAISGVERDYTVKVPLHPQHPEMGSRTLHLAQEKGVAQLYLASVDKLTLQPGRSVRLMNLFNVRIRDASREPLNMEYAGEDTSGELPILQWVPQSDNGGAVVVMPNLRLEDGLAERSLSSEAVGSVIQFVRFGFGRIDSSTEKGLTVYFAHK